MKITSGLILAALLAVPVMAQPPAGSPPPLTAPGAAPAPAVTPMPPTMPPMQAEAPAPTNKPAAKPKTTTKAPAKKPATTAKKPPPPKKSATPAAVENPAPALVVNEPAVAKQNNVNVRGKANINSEVVAHLKAGEAVTVLELVNVPHGTPPNWAKIALPASAHSWVNTSFIDANKTVKPAKLNVRSGPGENYSVIGLMHKGDAVKEVTTKGDWTEIEPAPGAFAFVAAHLLMHKEAPPAPPTPPQPPPQVTFINTPPPIAISPTEPSAVPAIPAVTVPPIVAPPDDTPPPPRIVQREGVVHGAGSIQAPSKFQLDSLENGKVLDFLYTTSTNLVLARYFGMTVHVTGEEGLDERWPNIPVITIQTIRTLQSAPPEAGPGGTGQPATRRMGTGKGGF